MVQTVLIKKRKQKVLWPPLHARPCESSFRVYYIYVTLPYICNSSKYTGWDMRLKNKTPVRRKTDWAVRPYVHSQRTRRSLALKPNQALPLTPSAPRI